MVHPPWHKETSTFVSRGRRRTISHPRSFCVAGVALAGVAQSHIHLRFASQAWQLMALGGALGPAWSRVMPRHFAWQAWHLVTSTLVSRGRRGTHGTGWRAWARLVARDAAALCVAGVALGGIRFGSTWQAWHNLTSTFVLRGRRGTHGPGWRAWARLIARDAAALCVARCGTW